MLVVLTASSGAQSKMKNLSPRTHFIVATVLTLILLIGSTVLQQLIFKADQEPATLSLSPTNFRTVQGGFIDVDILSGSGDTVFVTGLQAELTYEPTSLELVESVPATGWTTLSLATVPGRSRWSIVPLQTTTSIAEITGTTTLGRLRFKAVAAGVAVISFNQASTILAAVDPVQGNFVYNAATSVQSTAGTITAATESDLSFPETSLTTLTAPETTVQPLFGSQRIVSTYAAAGSRDAVVFVTLGYPGRAAIEFGLTPQLGNRVESLSESTQHTLQLSSLASQKQYYYRVVGEQVGEQSRVVGTTRSLTMPVASTTNVVSTEASEVIAFPNRTERDAALFVFPRDEAGGAVGGAEVALSAPEGITVSQPKKQLDYYRFDLTSQLSKKELVTFHPLADGEIALGSASTIFDPNYTTVAQSRTVKELVLDWNQRTLNFVLGAAILLFLFGVLFVRLVRSR